jgi:hypothetical protein
VREIMKSTRRELVFMLLASTAVESLWSDDTGTVSIVGTHVFDDGKKTVGITLVLKDRTWSKSEPGNRSAFFSTARGKYQTAPSPNIVQLLDANSKIAGQIEPLVPAAAKKGVHGNKGYSFEKGITLDWEVV